LCSPPDEQLIGIGGPAQCLGNPRDPRLGISATQDVACRCCTRPTHCGPYTWHQRFPFAPATVTVAPC